MQVWDTGIGIPEAEQAHIFEELYQAGNRARDREQGLGLGLAIVRRLAKLLGSDVEVRSRPGKGSVFQMFVPIANEPGAHHAIVHEMPAEPRVASGSMALVVDDDALARVALASTLERWGYEVVSAASVAEAEEYARELPELDLLVTDLWLADGSGLDIARALARPRLARVVTTGDTDPKVADAVRAEGIAFVRKPVRAGVLWSATRPRARWCSAREHRSKRGSDLALLSPTRGRRTDPGRPCRRHDSPRVQSRVRPQVGSARRHRAAVGENGFGPPPVPVCHPRVVGADFVLWCCFFPLLGIGAMWAWARVPWFGQLAGLFVLTVLACGTVVGTVLVARDVAATDRLVGTEESAECGSPGRSLPGRGPAPVGTHHVEMTIAQAAALGLPMHPSTDPWDVTIRTLGSRAIASYPRGPARGQQAFFADAGEIGDDEVVFVALRGHVMGEPIDPDEIITHETLELAWFWVVGDMLVVYGEANGGTLEVRDEQLSLIARATGTGALAEPTDSLVDDGRTGVFVVSAGDGFPAIGHLTADGRWTRSEIGFVGGDLSGLSSARSGGLCVWSSQRRGVVHVDGDPLRSQVWPLLLVLSDRKVELLASAIAWIVVLFALRALGPHALPWWALGRPRVRVGEVTRRASGAASWSEKGGTERTLDTGAWLGFESASAKPEEAVAIDVHVVSGNPAYRDMARETLRARWVVRGTHGEAAWLLRNRLLTAASRIGLVALAVGIPAIGVVIAVVTEH